MNFLKSLEFGFTGQSLYSEGQYEYWLEAGGVSGDFEVDEFIKDRARDM